jgi:hypothetical protein
MNRYTNGQRDRRIDIQTYRGTDGWIYKRTEGQTDRYTNRQRDIWIDIQTDRGTDG